MVKEKKTYRELREKHPNISALYARNASWKRTSPFDPIHLETQDFKIIDTGNKFARWFIRIPIKKGDPVYAPLRFREDEDFSQYKFHDSKLIFKGGRFFFHLTISKERPRPTHISSVLAVDLGEKVLATVVLWKGASKPTPIFLGKEVRGVRRHYAWLRKRLGERKLLRVIKRLKDIERRTVDWYLHNISKKLVKLAKENKAIILLGDLTGIRNRNRGKRLNRIVANMPFYRLSQFIEYKANWEGIPVAYASEAYTSRTCHFCHSDGKRPHQGLFVCPACGHQYNADYNAAYNQAERLSEYIFESGVIGSSPISGANFSDPASLTPPTLS